jgi:hypothetical protein
MTDPKPQLGTAAMQANIEYWRHRCEQERTQYYHALEQLIQWETKLHDLSLDLNK